MTKTRLERAWNVDHESGPTEAARWLMIEAGDTAPNPVTPLLIAAAQVFATLAVAEAIKAGANL